jgi:mRNA-degrading endonuclease RelE of RelBE toxin-antitoxin system
LFTIQYAEGVAGDLRRLPANRRAWILDRIEVQLRHQPGVPTRNRKILAGLVPPWDHVEPIWELRLDEYRIFYDVNEAELLVTIRAIRHKPPHKRTGEIL